MMFFKVLSYCFIEERLVVGREEEKGVTKGYIAVGWGEVMVIQAVGRDIHWGVGGRWSGVLTQAKPYVCVPISRVFSTVNQIVALEKSISHAENKAFDEEHNWKRPPSSTQ